MAFLKTWFKTLTVAALVAAFLHSGPAFAESASSGKVTEPEVQSGETEKTPANTNVLKEAFKKLVGTDEHKEDGEENAPGKTPHHNKKAETKTEPETGEPEKKESTNILKETFKKLVGKEDASKETDKAETDKTPETKQAETKPEGEPADADEEKPKEGIIKKALKTLIEDKEKTDAAKEETATLKEAAEQKKAEAEAKVESSEDKTKASAQKFISNTIDKIVETVKGDDQKKEEEDQPQQAKVETKPKTGDAPKDETTAEVKEEEKAEGHKSNNPLKEAFKKLVGTDDEKKVEGKAAPE
ncbi:hypothetical protein [Nitrospina gracilis]|uniref:hypothetical protein n=1 Tax=Nitrospina gracilis TaxID=35801 RepID=UPI001F34B750|nr:hypothetical protein [Nitrospina gracilis]MCF8719664.1 chemotaxis protein histidine kinase CheA [Nitrospina gracilis Nb-211]